MAIATKLSYWPVDAKAQQEPQDPWFLISVTLPKALQSNDSGEAPNPDSTNYYGGLEDTDPNSAFVLKLKNAE